MDLFQRQQFDFLLNTAAERLAERLQEHHGSCEAALRVLDQSTEPAEVKEFVSAIFSDFLLDNVDGACFVLRSLGQKKLGQTTSFTSDQTIEACLIQLARKYFLALLLIKTNDLIQQHLRYRPDSIESHLRREAETR